MNVMLLTTYAPSASRKAVEALGHACRVVNYRREALPGDMAAWSDVVVIHQGDNRTVQVLGPEVAEGLRVAGVRTVWWSYEPGIAGKHKLYKGLALACDEVIVCNEWERAWFGARHGCVRVDHAGIDPEFWAPCQPDLHWRERECYGVTASLCGHMYPNRQAALKCLVDAGVEALKDWIGISADACSTGNLANAGR